MALTQARDTRESEADVRRLLDERRYDDAWDELRRKLLVRDDQALWNVAVAALRAGREDGWTPPASRSVRLAVLCSYEGAELVRHLEPACAALRLDAALYAAPFGQLEQEALDPAGALAEFAPTHVLVASATEDLGLPESADRPAEVLAEQERRWTGLWEALANGGVRVVQHGFVVPSETPLGHLAARTESSRPALVRALNARLGAAAGERGVLLVDCERLAAEAGKANWLQPRLWHALRRPYGPEALPVLARQTAAVLAADVGLAARCLVVDLDGTLWGGVAAEEGPTGVDVGDGPTGEAYAAFQEYLRSLRGRGLLLAVASHNDPDVAQEPFEQNRGMRLRLDDFAAFVADWRRKPEQVAEIAERLGLPLESLVFADDDAAECAEVAAALPDVDTIRLDVPPSERVRALAACVRLEPTAPTREDGVRAASYAALARTERLRTEAPSLEDFWLSLELRARVAPLAPEALERAAQLTQKTSQFNLTLRRRTPAELDLLCREPRTICRTLELEDRFARHGLVGLAMAVPDADEDGVAALDTLLLSCRVIGRTAERHLLAHVAAAAAEAGFARLRGVYVPGPRNALVGDLYPRLGFTPVPGRDDRWDLDLGGPPLESPFVQDLP
jgi:FkbH-like protein